jgi:putative N6-adenine-specific DNA methylase
MKTSSKALDYRRFFAVATPGLEGVTVEEIRVLGGEVLKVTRGGVTFAGPLELGYRANLWLRTAAAVRMRLIRFHAPSERLLAERAREVDWAAYLPDAEAVVLQVSSTRSGLGHGERLENIVRDALPPRPANASAHQEIHVRLVQDTCTLSLDMSGELLHRRGYRQETSRGPLRETLAAALILAAGWDPATPLLDPMCGSGTLPIEAALIATHRAPSLERWFACERWPLAKAAPGVWDRLRAQARELAVAAPPAPIQGSDRNAGAVGVARRNAERAGVGDIVGLERRDLAEVTPPPGAPGLVLTNPPFGRRVTEVRELESLYSLLGQVLAQRFHQWQAAVVSADPRLERRIDLPRRGEIEFLHGGLRCRLLLLDPGPAPQVAS